MGTLLRSIKDYQFVLDNHYNYPFMAKGIFIPISHVLMYLYST